MTLEIETASAVLVSLAEESSGPGISKQVQTFPVDAALPPLPLFFAAFLRESAFAIAVLRLPQAALRLWWHVVLPSLGPFLEACESVDELHCADQQTPSGPWQVLKTTNLLAGSFAKLTSCNQ